MKHIPKKLGAGLCLTGLTAFLPTLSTQASIITRNADITNLFGTSDSYWNEVSDDALNLQIGLRAKNKSGAVASDDNGNYTLKNVNYPKWNFEFSVNVNKNGTASTTLANSGYFFSVVVDNGLLTYNLASYWDNDYGNNSSAHGSKLTGLYSVMGSSYSIMQNSEPTLASFSDPTTGHTFSLLVKDTAGNVVLDDTITVNGGFSTVPEPSTVIAGALLLLPFGVGVARSLRRNAKA
jgi:hypothetical protein